MVNIAGMLFQFKTQFHLHKFYHWHSEWFSVNSTERKFILIFRNNPRVKGIDMLHASDYAEMSLDELNNKIRQLKANDKILMDNIV